MKNDTTPEQLQRACLVLGEGILLWNMRPWAPGAPEQPQIPLADWLHRMRKNMESARAVLALQNIPMPDIK